MEITILQLHKRSSYDFKNIQDKFAFNEANRCFSLADGTTQSFNSEIWAEIITKHFVENPIFEEKMLISDFTTCVQKYKDVKVGFSNNPAIASLEKTKLLSGGTATFLGLQFLKNNQFKIIGCGDTNLFIKNNNSVNSYPYTTLESLSANNFFINTEKLIQGKVDETFFFSSSSTFQDKDVLILATDALSRLLLKQQSVINELIEIDDFDTFHKFCLTYWEKKEMEEDDISVIIIKINVEAKYEIKIITPNSDFSFPKEKEVVFTPLGDSITTPFKQFDSDMNIQEKKQLDTVTNELYQVKNKVKIYTRLLIVIIAISCINLFYYMNSTHNSNSENSINSSSSLNRRIENLEQQVKTLSKVPTQSQVVHKNDLTVTQIQQILLNEGYDVKVDGKMGTATQKAWKEYKVKVDGKMGTATQKAWK